MGRPKAEVVKTFPKVAVIKSKGSVGSTGSMPKGSVTKKK